MVHFIYKDKMDLLVSNIDLSSVHYYIYRDGLTEQVKDNIDFIQYDSITDEKVLKGLKKQYADSYDDGVDIYVRCYELDAKGVDRKKKIMIDSITYYNSGDKSADYFYVFFDALYRKVYYEYLNIKREYSILDDLGDLGLLAFSDSPTIRKDNNVLFHSFLFDRSEIERKYDSLMGEGEFKKLNDLCFQLEMDYAINQKNVADSLFFEIINRLKVYFLKNMKRYYLYHNREVCLEEKTAMVINFNSKYSELIETQRAHQENRLLANKKVDL